MISYLLRQRGGQWHSADLDERAVMSIRQLVGSNVPHLKPGSLLNRVRHAIGLPDERHGHLRPGYRLEGLRQLLGPAFVIEESPPPRAKLDALLFFIRVTS